MIINSTVVAAAPAMVNPNITSDTNAKVRARLAAELADAISVGVIDPLVSTWRAKRVNSPLAAIERPPKTPHPIANAPVPTADPISKPIGGPRRVFGGGPTTRPVPGGSCVWVSVEVPVLVVPVELLVEVLLGPVAVVVVGPGSTRDEAVVLVLVATALVVTAVVAAVAVVGVVRVVVVPATVVVALPAELGRSKIATVLCCPAVTVTSCRPAENPSAVTSTV